MSWNGEYFWLPYAENALNKRFEPVCLPVERSPTLPSPPSSLNVLPAMHLSLLSLSLCGCVDLLHGHSVIGHELLLAVQQRATGYQSPTSLTDECAHLMAEANSVGVQFLKERCLEGAR